MAENNTNHASESATPDTSQTTEYFCRARSIAHQLALASKPVDDDDLITYIMTGLPSGEYGSLRTTLNTRVDPINMEDLLAMLLIHEAQLDEVDNIPIGTP
ncbi:hypothetical protein EJ110_NYTH45097 [Nymphaea thermarum]|nr:hypothetical protein EJ110_NYTH45097 [Nymphaea thermarum]